MKNLIYILLIFITTNSIAQNYADKEYYLVDSLDLDALTETDRQLVDSCLKVFHNSKDDTLKANSIFTIIDDTENNQLLYLYSIYLHSFLNYTIEENTDKTIMLKLRKKLAQVKYELAYEKQLRGEFSEALQLHFEALEINHNDNNIEEEIESLAEIADCYEDLGDYRTALKYNLDALKLASSTNNTNICYILNNIAITYDFLNNPTNSIKYSIKGLDCIRKNKNNQLELAGALINLSSTIQSYSSGDSTLTNKNKALEYAKEAYLMSSKTNNYWLYAPSITQLANVYFDIGNLDTAAKYYNLSLEIRRQTEDKSIIVIGLLDIGEYYFGANKYDDAIIYLEEGLDIAKEVGYPRQILKATQLLYQTYDKLGNIHKAYDMHKLYSTMKDSLNNVEARENSMKQLALYEFEKAKQKAKEKARVEAEEIQRRDNLEYSLIFLGILLLFGGVLMLGFIKVSANVAEGLIFFSFLILFEFVLVFVEPYLNEYTDGEPIYTLLINAGIALLIFPLHDKLETVLKKRIVKK